MQITETLADGLKREFKVVISAKDIESKVDTKLVEVGRSAKIPGFRPGKIPPSMLKQRFGQSVMGEVVEQVVSESVNKTISDKGVRPAMQPKIEIDSFEDGSDLEYTMSLEILPDIEPMDFSKLQLQQLKVDVSDEEVEETLQRLADQARDSTPVKDGRKSRTGDVVVIDFVGKLDGKPFEGGSASDHNLTLGSGTFIPGFEDQLVDLSAGEHVHVKVTFPDDYASPELAGKEAVFEVDLKEIREAAEVEFNDALAQKFGQKSLDELRKAIREQIQSDYNGLSRNRLKRELLDALAAGHDFGVPEGMVDAEFEAIWKQIEEQRKKGDLEDEDKDKSEDELKAEYRDIAARRVRLGLLLSDVGQTNNISVAQEEMTRAIVQQAQQFPGREREIMEYYQKNEDALGSLRAPLFEEKVVDFILEMAKVTDKVVTMDELIAEPETPSKSEKKPKKASAKSKASKSQQSKSAAAKAKPAKSKAAAAPAAKAKTKKATKDSS
ncbi:MAG: trigger factor [Geminicoccaceae bacterium]